MTPEINKIFTKQLEIFERNGPATHSELIALELEAFRIYNEIQRLKSLR